MEASGGAYKVINDVSFPFANNIPHPISEYLTLPAYLRP